MKFSIKDFSCKCDQIHGKVFCVVTSFSRRKHVSKIIAQNYLTLNHNITWSWNQNLSTLRSSYLMVSFHFKEDGQVFSVILPTCKVMKKKRKKKEIFEKKLKASVLKHKTWHHYVCKKKKCLHKKYKDFQFLMIRAKGW